MVSWCSSSLSSLRVAPRPLADWVVVGPGVVPADSSVVVVAGAVAVESAVQVGLVAKAHTQPLATLIHMVRGLGGVRLAQIAMSSTVGLTVDLCLIPKLSVVITIKALSIPMLLDNMVIN